MEWRACAANQQEEPIGVGSGGGEAGGAESRGGHKCYNALSRTSNVGIQVEPTIRWTDSAFGQLSAMFRCESPAVGRRWRRSLMVRVSPSLPPSGALLRARGPIYPARLALAQGLRLSVCPLFRLQPARSQRAIKLARWPPKFSRSSPARPPAPGRAAAAELGTCDDGGGNSSVARGRAPPTDAEGGTDGRREPPRWRVTRARPT